MDKNWLIRTKSNHILGPISKEKVLELYTNHSVKPDDEVCTGNGFWFFIREDDMVERFLKNDEVQTFNPISEAKDVLTASDTSNVVHAVREDITKVGGLNISMLNTSKPVETKPSPAPVAVVEAPAPVTSAPEAQVAPKAAPPKVKSEPSQEVKKKSNVIAKPKNTATPKVPLKKQSYLKYIGIMGFLVLFLLIYFRKAILQNVFKGESTSISFISSAHAQEDIPEKKKSF